MVPKVDTVEEECSIFEFNATSKSITFPSKVVLAAFVKSNCSCAMSWFARSS